MINSENIKCSKEGSKSFFDNIELGVPKCSSLPSLSSGKQFIIKNGQVWEIFTFLRIVDSKETGKLHSSIW